MKSTHLFASLFALPLFGQKLQNQNAHCMSPEEEAAMLQKLMHDEGGNIDPEEMQAIIRKARGQKNRKPPQFMRLTGPIKMMTFIPPSDGFRFEFMVPFS